MFGFITTLILMLISVNTGLNPKQPAFMAEHKKQRKTLPEQVSTRQSDGQSDEEWTPNTAEEGNTSGIQLVNLRQN